MAFWGPLIATIAGSAITGMFNRDAQSEANSDSVKLWREQSAYNTPINQMKRLEEAGLNPNLAYGQIADSKASTPPQRGAVKYDQPHFNLADYAQVRNMQEQNKLIRAQAFGAEADAKLKAHVAEYYKSTNSVPGDPPWFRSAVRAKGLIGDYLDSVKNQSGSNLKQMSEFLRGGLKNVMPKGGQINFVDKIPTWERLEKGK